VFRKKQKIGDEKKKNLSEGLKKTLDEQAMKGKQCGILKNRSWGNATCIHLGKKSR